jgi:type III restriction enzyme
MRDISRFKNADLVLKVNSNIDPAVFDITRYEAFLEALCSEREYQRQAILTVCSYLFGGAYRDQSALAEENFNVNAHLQEKYTDFRRMAASLEFPDRLACSVDLATGTGKSYVIYGIARIALAAGVVDRVLVLCPSNTIEAGLTDKFVALSGDRDFADLLPKDSVVRVPHIIHATETVMPGDICIENIHATYKRTKSAIDDSFKGKGARTLVLCDEAHHIYSPEGDIGLKKWKEFLVAPYFGFRYIVGLSGTCYVDDEYFRDVAYRYSLRQAIEDGVVKTIDYVAEDSSGDQNEKFQKIYENHKEAQRKYRRVKPLTVLVTKDIAGCKKLEDDLAVFLATKGKTSKEEAAKKILRVHTPRMSGHGAKEDKAIPANVERLRSGEPDEKNSPTEWIVSVSMLTEGWDAQNVFQIVPHEERAFNSKLLVAQVLGRGLRVPSEYRGACPIVTVFNHDAWSGKIKHLVDEVLEIEKRITSFPIKKSPNYDFKIYSIDYAKTEDVVETKQTSEYRFDMEFVNLSAQRGSVDKSTVYERAITGEHREKTTLVELEMFGIDQVVADIHNKFKAIDLETKSNYAKRYPREAIRKLIRTSLIRIGYKGDGVSKENRQRILSAFGNLRRPGSKSIRYRVTPKSLTTVCAVERHKDSVAIGAIRHRGATVFYDDNSKKADPEIRQLIQELEKDESLPRSAIHKVENMFNFKTCLSVVITTSEPERKFVRLLSQLENAQHITAWIKNADTGFYGIEYSYSRGDFSKRGIFNPDFFILIGKSDLLVVEVKGDEELTDPSPENKGKRKAALEHFKNLNGLQNEIRYHFCFISPEGYDVFFAELREGRAMQFQSQLDVTLNGDGTTKIRK